MNINRKIPKQPKGLVGLFRSQHGIASYKEIRSAGFDKGTLRALVKSGVVHKIDRALYQLADFQAASYPDLQIIAAKFPSAIVCLLSALAFHEATEEIPRFIYLAIPRGVHAKRISYPPIKYFRIAKKQWAAGADRHRIDGRTIRVYGLARTVADCFKFRNKIGVDLARRVLKTAVLEKGVPPKEIMRFAKVCRVTKIVQPLIETIL